MNEVAPCQTTSLQFPCQIPSAEAIHHMCSHTHPNLPRVQDVHMLSASFVNNLPPILILLSLDHLHIPHIPTV